MGKVVIKTAAGYVTGFSRQHECVQVCVTEEGAKKFTPAAAKKFVETYADAGYGLPSEKTFIQSVLTEKGK